MKNLLFALLCFFVVPAVGFTAPRSLIAEEKANPQEKLDTAIPEAIRLLEEKDYEKLLKAFVAPEELERILKDLPLKEFAKQFASRGKAETLLKVLKAVKDIEPKLNEEGTVATYKLPEPVDGKSDISFQKIEKLWYIKN